MGGIATDKANCEIVFGKRLREVIDDIKQSHKTTDDAEKRIVRSLGDALGVSIRTIYRILNNDRYATPTEQKKIADTLGFPIERLLQLDTIDTKERVHGAINNKNFLIDALVDAKYLVTLALGATEKFEAYKDLGRVFYELREYRDAHDAWRNAYDYAKKSGDQANLYAICNNLMHSASKTKKYLELEKILVEVSDCMEQNPVKLGGIKYFLGAMHYEQGQYKDALEYFTESLNQFTLTMDAELIGKAQHNIGSVYLKVGDFKTAVIWQEKALQNLQDSNMITQLITLEEYGESLLGLNRCLEAESLAKESLSKLEHCSDPPYQVFKARMLLVLAKANNVSDFAERAVEISKDDSTDLRIAEFLHDFYLRNGDAKKALYYHEIVLTHKHHRGGFET